MLDRGFEEAGFCVVRGPDVIWGGDIRTFHPPPGRFDGIIGGDPCQSHSALANLVRAKGLEPSFPDMTGEYQRVVEEARPAWFLRENVPRAPDVKPEGYDVRSFLIDNSTLDSGDGTGNEQMRRRRFWFGVDTDPYTSLKWDRCRCCEDYWCHLHRSHAHECACWPIDEPCPELRAHIEFSLFTVDTALTVNGSHAGPRDAELVGMSSYSLSEMCRLQGLPENWLEHQPWTMQAKRKMVGNGVAVQTSRALANAIIRALA